ncbi:Uncharacterised protein [Mycobacterium tuberculosis]|nr:Uncharacterised protein [Mycobacterium tuberculosis]CNM32850.1 Uncharacterised protein [Mycobacterium tuberculosis]
MHIGVTCISLIYISQVVVCQLRNSTITLFWDERAVLSGSAGGNAAASVPFTGSDQ